MPLSALKSACTSVSCPVWLSNSPCHWYINSPAGFCFRTVISFIREDVHSLCRVKAHLQRGAKRRQSGAGGQFYFNLGVLHGELNQPLAAAELLAAQLAREHLRPIRPNAQPVR